MYSKNLTIKIILFAAAAAVLALLMPGVTVCAEQIIDSGLCGADARWEVADCDEGYILTVSGSGAAEWGGAQDTPWADYRSGIVRIEVQDGITSIGAYAFYNCVNLSEVNLPDDLDIIEEGLFMNCSGLAEIDIPAGVSEISDGAFDNCSGLMAIEIPDSVTRIGDYAFWNCSSLSDVTFTASVRSIGKEAFFNCALTSVVIDGDYLTIGEGAFRECPNLTHVTLTDGVSEIGEDVFDGCSRLQSVQLTVYVTAIGDNAFGGADRTGSVTGGILYIYYEGSKNDWDEIDYKKHPGQKIFYNIVEPDQISVPENVTIYRLYNPKTKEHLWTASRNEYDTLVQYGWNQEGAAWRSPGDGTGVYRLYNPKSKDHHYTSSKREAEVLIDLHGWRYDNKGKPVFYSGGFMNVYRLYNPQFTCGSHHLTKSANEYNTLFKTYNWKQEGIAFYSID